MSSMYFYISSDDDIIASEGYKLVVDADVNADVSIYYSTVNPLPDSDDY